MLRGPSRSEWNPDHPSWRRGERRTLHWASRFRSSDEEPVIGELEMITDGDKEAADGSYRGTGTVASARHDRPAGRVRDLRHPGSGIIHKQPRVYFDVIVQISSDPDFIQDVKTIFNNDMDNSAGLGVGTDMHYVDTHFGEIFDAKGVARPIRPPLQPGQHLQRSEPLYRGGGLRTTSGIAVTPDVWHPFTWRAASCSGRRP